MNIRQISMLTAVITAVLFVSTIATILWYLNNERVEKDNTHNSTSAFTALSKATIELSLERSLMQVTLALDPPIAPAFKDMIDEQRNKSSLGFKKSVEIVKRASVTSDDEANGRFLNAIQRYKSDIEKIRTAADTNLAKPIALRDANTTDFLPEQMKATIIDFASLFYKLKPENVSLSSRMITLSEIQQYAWEVREYGG